MANKGRSDRNFTGGYTHYDSRGRKIGRSDRNFTGGYTNYDTKGRKIGTADPNAFGGYTHRDANRKVVGKSDPQILGRGYSHNNSTSGCYVATCVYGSYDCPEVWTLRRFRDYCLDETWYGRAFIKCYYRCSPVIVKWFGDKAWFKNLWKPVLNNLVYKLQKQGYESTAYKDKEYN